MKSARSSCCTVGFFRPIGHVSQRVRGEVRVNEIAIKMFGLSHVSRFRCMLASLAIDL